jgi:hypothetical protein
LHRLLSTSGWTELGSLRRPHSQMGKRGGNSLARSISPHLLTHNSPKWAGGRPADQHHVRANREEPTSQPPMEGKNSLTMGEGSNRYGNREAQEPTLPTLTREEENARKQRVLQNFREALRKQLMRTTTEWTPLTTIMQWLSGWNRKRPCTILANLDIRTILTWIEQDQDITSYIKTCSFIPWKLISRHVASSHGNRKKTKNSSLPCDRLDWLVQNRNTADPNGEDSPDQECWLEQRLCRNVKGILQDHSSSAPLL